MASRVRETIIQCIGDTQSSVSNEDRQKALQTLVSITKISPQNRNLVAQIDGAISSLLPLSKSPSPPEIQILSLSVLFNLSLNPNLKHSLAQRDTILHLNTLILSPNSIDSSKLAASLLCSLAMLDKNKAKFGVAGTVQVKLLNCRSVFCSKRSNILMKNEFSDHFSLIHFHSGFSEGNLGPSKSGHPPPAQLTGGAGAVSRKLHVGRACGSSASAYSGG